MEPKGLMSSFRNKKTYNTLQSTSKAMNSKMSIPIINQKMVLSIPNVMDGLCTAGAASWAKADELKSSKGQMSSVPLLRLRQIEAVSSSIRVLTILPKTNMTLSKITEVINMIRKFPFPQILPEATGAGAAEAGPAGAASCAKMD
jgi:hypothetical protein